MKKLFKIKPKVLFIYTFRIGGISASIEMYKNVLAKNNFFVHEVGFIANMDVSNNETTTVINQQEQRGLIASIKNTFALTKTIYKLNKIHHFDVFQVNTIWQLIALRLVPGLSSKKILYFFHGLETKENESWGSKIDKPYFHLTTGLFEQMLPLIATKIVIFSDYSKAILIKHIFLLRFFEKKLVKGDFFVSSVEKKARNPIKGALTLVNFGRAEPRKGLDVLLEAVNMLKNTLSIQLIIISPVSFFHSGFLKTYEKMNLFDKVTILHKANHKQKESIICKSDLFIMPSRDLETFGITVIESLAVGLPVISSNTGALNEILSKFDTKFIFKPYSAKSLAKKIYWYYQLSNKEKLAYQNLALSTATKNYTLNPKKERGILKLFN